VFLVTWRAGLWGAAHVLCGLAVSRLQITASDVADLLPEQHCVLSCLACIAEHTERVMGDKCEK